MNSGGGYIGGYIGGNSVRRFVEGVALSTRPGKVGWVGAISKPVTAPTLTLQTGNLGPNRLGRSATSTSLSLLTTGLGSFAGAITLPSPDLELEATVVSYLTRRPVTGATLAALATVVTPPQIPAGSDGVSIPEVSFTAAYHWARQDGAYRSLSLGEGAYSWAITAVTGSYKSNTLITEGAYSWALTGVTGSYKSNTLISEA